MAAPQDQYQPYGACGLQSSSGQPLRPQQFPNAMGFPIGGQGAAGGYLSQVQENHNPNAGKVFLRSRRRRINWIPILICVLVPWCLFAAVDGLLSFQLHYTESTLVTLLVLALFVIVAGVGTLALGMRFKFFFKGEQREPSWLIFLFISMLLAWVVGYMQGSSNYGYMEKYYNFNNLNSYTGISPVAMRGQQLMDAGEITFAAGTYLDFTKAMGFKNSNTYCVIPIVQQAGNSSNATTLATYDFWAVGTNCCSSTTASFYCTGFNDPYANGGLRLMSDSERSFYRLAVQEAEAAYKIKSVHPLFFEWTRDPSVEVASWRTTAISNYCIWVVAAVVAQAFLTAVVALYFSKFGSLQ